MNIKMNKIAIIFLILMVAIPIFSFNVGATESTIITSMNPSSTAYKSIAVRSDGVMFAIAQHLVGTIIYTRIYRSDDNGAVWVDNKSYSNSLSYQGFKSCCIAVDNDDTVHVVATAWEGGYCFKHYSLNTTGSWSDGFNLGSGTTNQPGKGCDIAFDSENMYVVWAYKNTDTSHYLRYRAYNFVLETWGATTTLKSSSTDLGRASISIFDNDLYVFYTHDDNEYDIDYAKFHNSNSTWTYNHDLVSSTIYTYYKPKSCLYDNKLYVFYQGNSSTNDKKQILFKSFDGSWSGEVVLHSDLLYDQESPTISVNSNGNLNVVWSGKSVLSSTYYQLRQSVFDGVSWSDVAFISSGSTHKKYPHLCYQDYPIFTWLIDGVCIAYVDDTNDDLKYIDSGSLIWYSGGDGEYGGDFEFDANNNIGSLDTECILDFSKKDVEFKYQVPTTINATGFDLLVGNTMHSVASDLSNYDLYINGDPMGNPTEWKQYGSQYVLRWTFASEKVITNSEILFEVWHNQLISGINYWQIGVSCGYNDLDGDGIALLKYSNTYPNGVYDGTLLIKDVAYQLYYNVIQFAEDETPVEYNTISAVNTTYYVGESVALTYTIKSCDLVYDNYIRIWNDDTSTEITLGSMQGFPYLCTHQVETKGFVPFTSVNYTAHLYINSVEVDNVSFYPQDHINSDMYVFTYDNPSNVGQKIWVSYKFDHPTGKDGAIFVSHTPNLNNYISVNYLSDGDSGFWTTSHDTVGTYYYIMAVDITGNGTYGIVNNGIHAHIVKSEHGNNFFTLRWSNLRLDIDGTTTQTIIGECNMVSGNCYIYDNNNLVKTITESPFFYQYQVHTAGLHSVEMRLITNVTTVLCTQNYTISTYTGEEEVEQVEDFGYVIRDWIYNTGGDFGIFIVGVLIILGFMFIPFALVLYVNITYNKNVALGDIHWGIYLIFAIVGVIVVVQLHLADLWIILLICIVSIAITVISYNGRNS